MASLAPSASAAPLTITLEQPDQTGAAGATYEFFGTIRNDTGTALQTSDLFFDFSGFDPGFLAPNQLLGSTLSSIAPGSTSATLALFEFSLASTAMPGETFGSDVILQDSLANLSDPVTVTISVVPEPSSGLLLLVAIAPLVWCTRRRRVAEGARRESRREMTT